MDKMIDSGLIFFVILSICAIIFSFVFIGGFEWFDEDIPE